MDHNLIYDPRISSMELWTWLVVRVVISQSPVPSEAWEEEDLHLGESGKNEKGPQITFELSTSRLLPSFRGTTCTTSVQDEHIVFIIMTLVSGMGVLGNSLLPPSGNNDWCLITTIKHKSVSFWIHRSFLPPLSSDTFILWKLVFATSHNWKWL